MRRTCLDKAAHFVASIEWGLEKVSAKAPHRRAIHHV